MFSIFFVSIYTMTIVRVVCLCAHIEAFTEFSRLLYERGINCELEDSNVPRLSVETDDLALVQRAADAIRLSQGYIIDCVPREDVGLTFESPPPPPPIHRV